jgi:phosphatidylethanolamine-binding protein (PEBP) family uncharacterized protein
MKKIFKYVPIILGLVMVMSSCGDDDETEPAVVINPTLSVSVNGNQVASGATVNVETGDSVSLSITANRVGSGKDLNTMSITQSGANQTTPFNIQAGDNDPYTFGDGNPQTLKNADDETFVGTGVFTGITGTEGTTTYTITVTDKDALSTTVSFSIAVANAVTATPLSITKTGHFWHVAGPTTSVGAWNISTDTLAPSGSVQTGTVLTNTDAASTTFTGGFSLSTGSDMVVGTSANFDNATVESATATYTAGAKLTVNASPAVGDVYVIKMANGNYVVAKVTILDPTDTSGGGTTNVGKMTFDYKK